MKKKIKILILANDSSSFYQFRRQLIQKFVQNGLKVSVSIPVGEFGDELKELGCKLIDIPVDRRGKNPLKDIKLLFHYISTISSYKPDIVLTYTIKPNVYGGLACRICRKPYIANITGLGTSLENKGFLRNISILLYKIGERCARCVFFQNTANRDFFVNNHMVHGAYRLIPGSGVDLSVHCFEPYPDDDGTVRFLFIGRIMKNKGIEELLEAIDVLHGRYPDISLDILGGYDEDYSREIEQACGKGYVRYHGQQKDVNRFIKNAHCVVLPSYHEGMSNVMLEAQATGRPVITTNVPGCRETFDEGISGFGCEARSVDSLVMAMEKFIQLSQEERSQMGVQGRHKMEREFDRNIVINAYLEEIKA